MKTIVYLVLGFLIALNIYYCSYPLIRGEINFTTEVARDFLLLKEIDAKKIILIGPRSNASGLFHGPLWSYLNYPVYRIAQGNPVYVGWFWILLAIASISIGYIGTKRLFGKLPALVFALLYSSNFITHINGMFHSDATIYLMPIYILSAISYAKSKKIKVILLHLFSASMIIQLNIGVGIPLLILSSVFCLFIIIRYKLWRQLGLFLLIPFFLFNFLLFETRHNFFMSKSAYEFWKFQQTWRPLSPDFFIKNRLETTANLRIIINPTNSIEINLIFSLLVIASIFQIKKSRKYGPTYIIIFYFYFGFMLLSFLNKGVILSHFVYLLVPLTVFWFASFMRGKFLLFFLPVLIYAIILNVQSTIEFQRSFDNYFMDKRQESWRGLNTVSDFVISRAANKPFGYFVFSPDAFAYGPRYAMSYNFQKARAGAFEYAKKPTTFVIAAPAPQNDPYLNYIWWRKNPVKITSDPIITKKFSNGFTVEEYELSETEQMIPHDNTIELGIHFR